MFRTESDLLGDVQVPADALFGAQTQRAIVNFPLKNERTIGSYPRLIEALLRVKQAAALTNARGGFLKPEISEAICKAADAVIAEKRFDAFPIHRLHGGGGTSANMNANEVLANLAEEALGGRRGEYKIVHPNDHVNLHQSTNDVYPTACHIAIFRQCAEFNYSMGAFLSSLTTNVAQLAGEVRIARTCLQDAVDSTFGDLFGGYVTLIARSVYRVNLAADRLHAVNLGGTAIGRASDAPQSYRDGVIAALRETTGDAAFALNPNLFDAAQNPDDMIAVSAELNLLARALIKICKDLRLLSSGPEAGLGEIRLPAVQPGSSMMPGKINPVIPEFAIQLCMQAIGCHTVCEMALDHGELDLNVWESAIVFNILDAMELLSAAMDALGEKCLRGLQPVSDRNARHADSIVPLLTRLMQQHGYARINAICKEAKGDPQRIRELLRNSGLL